jgi:type I restriction-modification system DNA methylase subunit
MSELRTDIKQAIKGFTTGKPLDRGRKLLNALGYQSDNTEAIAPNNWTGFKAQFVDGSRPFIEGNARVKEWQTVDLLFQLCEDDLKHQDSLFSGGRFDNKAIYSYAFFCVTLSGESYSRTDLAKITREINKLFDMPAMILYRYGDNLTIAVIDRRLHKRDETKDVLEKKVTLIKDISVAEPIRAHIEILYDLALPSLVLRHKVDTFVALHNAWRKTLDISALNRKFYRELFNWYLYAVKTVTFPNPDKLPDEVNNSINVIRLLTRLIFCWFIKEKGLIPEALFNQEKIQEVLVGASPCGCPPLGGDADKGDHKGTPLQRNNSTYYKAILQNLFFATLNTEMKQDNPDSRRFIAEEKVNGVNPDYNNFTVYRHKNLFKDPAMALRLFEDIPFLNGGLFECLDTVETVEGKNRETRYDGFSSTTTKQPVVPDVLFFGQIANVDFSNEYGGKSGNHETVTGLIDILNGYKFTVAENTPLEEEVALDPELLGKVFENLLASYNPETRSTARNQTGSFYTPREIVNYMVDESLKAYLSGGLDSVGASPCGCPPVGENRNNGGDADEGDRKGSPLQEKLLILFSYADTGNPFADDEGLTDQLIKAISNASILDPACGSGAFPMGVLHRMVHILGKLDPNNRKWKQAQLDIVEDDRKKAEELRDEAVREAALGSVEERLAYIEASFDCSHHELDYLRKLFLIENCIYGVDIQNIAVQIAKLRFFISLIVEQKKDPSRPNLGILAMPNLETKFVAADSLIALERPQQRDFGSHAVERAEFELRQVRERVFYARKYKDKKELRKQEKVKREALEKALVGSNWGKAEAHQVAAWNPFDVSSSAPFFDPVMMFGIKVPPPLQGEGRGGDGVGGFNIVIGNPPYIQIQSFSGMPQQKAWEAQNYETYAKTGDVYCLFYERGFNLLAGNGTLTYITSNQWMRTNYGKKLRQFFADKTAPKTLIDFGDHQVFESATVNSNIIVIEKPITGDIVKPMQAVRIEDDFKADNDLAGYVSAKGIPLAELSSDSWVVSSGPDYIIRKQIEKVGIPLKNWDISINYGIKTGRDEAFIISRAKRDELIAEDPKSAEILKPLLRGRDIKRYKTEYADLWLISSHNGYGNVPPVNVPKDYPAVWKHLQRVNNESSGAVEKRQDQGRHWSNLRNCAYVPNFAIEKICWGNLAVSAQFALVKAGMYVSAPSPLIAPASKYMLTVLNSTTGDYYIHSLGVTRSGGFMEYKPMFVENLPIPKIAPTAQLPYECLVDCILFAHETGLTAEAATLEWVINVMVYGLYFEEEMKKADCYINDRVAEVVKPFKPEDTDEFKTEYVQKLNLFFLKDKAIYHGLVHSRNVKSVEIIHDARKK